ncbi:MAG: hypothetical protein A3F17_03210 [Gammaproteobacteria bacterium RIFCSPHIGHO2_12_FULL_41_15]|nr:MAG: hypothetical protein A3F17_03210 [Gammaproteobacteria bacterium RIFCSPHIGHO2_12_FULL_41_15]
MSTQNTIIALGFLFATTMSFATTPSPKKEKNFIFIENAQTATITPFPSLQGWDKLTLYNGSSVIPYFSFHGNIAGHFTAQEFYLNTVVGLPQQDGSNVKTGFLTFSNYQTVGGHTYQNGGRVIQLADSDYDSTNNKITYLIKGTKGSPIELGTLINVSIVVAASFNQETASKLFVLYPALRLKGLGLRLNNPDFGLSQKVSGE